MFKNYLAKLEDPFKVPYLLKIAIQSSVLFLTTPALKILNSLEVKGKENLKELPEKNVLFISNHQCAFMDGIAIYRSLLGVSKFAGLPLRSSLYYIAATETMKSHGLLPKILMIAGCISLKRDWRDGSDNVKRGPDFRALKASLNGLENGWLINFPQGTTRKDAPVRKGILRMIERNDCIVIPIELSNFEKAFNKLSVLWPKSFGNKLSIEFKEPLKLDSNMAPEKNLEIISKAIGLNKEKGSEKKIDLAG